MIGIAKKNPSRDSDPYALTVTFKNLNSHLSAKAQFKGTYKLVCKILEESTEYELFPEWRIESNSIHYHGTIIILDRIKWHKSTYKKLSNLGFIKLKKVTELQGWLEYSQKESLIANEILKPIRFPIKNGCIKHLKEEVKIIDDEVVKKRQCNCIECLLTFKEYTKNIA